MNGKRVGRVYQVIVEAFEGSKLVDRPLSEKNAAIVRRAIADFGYESVADIVNASDHFEHIRLNDPQAQFGDHRDFAVEWLPE